MAFELRGYRFVLTGKTGNRQRRDVEAAIRAADGEVVDAVDHDTILVCRDYPHKPKHTKKLEDAISYGIPIINDVTFLEAIEGQRSWPSGINEAKARVMGTAAPKPPAATTVDERVSVATALSALAPAETPFHAGF